MQILQLIRPLTWFGVGVYCLYSAKRSRSYVAGLRRTAGNLRIKRFQVVLTGLGILFLVGALGELVSFLRVGPSDRGTAWSGLVMIGMGFFTLFQFGLTPEPLFFNGLNTQKKSFSAWASRLAYILLALVFFYWGVQDIVHSLL
jgi:hypothetical protein